MYKRILSFFSALVLCAGITLGSLSFMPKSSAVSDFEFPFSQSEVDAYIQQYKSNYNHVVAFVYSYAVQNVDYHVFCIVAGSSNSGPPIVTLNNGSVYFSRCDAGIRWLDYNGLGWRTFTPPISYSVTGCGVPSPYYLDSGSEFSNLSISTFNYSFKAEPLSSIPVFYDFQPFYFPELPYGFFDGHINSIDGSFDLDLGTLSGTSSDGGTYSLPSGLIGDYSGDNYTRVNTNDTSSGDIFLDSGISSTLSTSGTWSANSGSGSIHYQPSYNETARFRTWAVVSASSYCYFVCDTRNIITASLESVSGDSGVLRFSAVGDDSVHYPFYCIEFAYDGTKIQTLSALPNGFTVNFKGGTLEQDQDTGIWSCDPLYHGFWLSDGCPPVVFSSLTDESYKWLANPVFGEEAFVLNFLNVINESINNLNHSVSSAISNQTSTFQNMDAPSNFDPTDVNNMLEYGSLESDFQAPSTDDIFSIDSGTFTDGMGFWRDRMNELLFFSGSPALPMTIFSLSLGLAVLIIGRRVSGGGAA